MGTVTTTRRLFLAGVASAPLLMSNLVKTAAWPVRGKTSQRRAQVNAWGPPYTTGDFPYLNHMKLCDRLWQILGTPTADPYAVLDADGYPQSKPSGVTNYINFLGVFLTDNDPWVLTWDGTGTVVLDAWPETVSVATSSTTNRIEYTVTSGTLAFFDSIFVQVNISAITGGGSYPKNIRVFRKSTESRLNSGEILNDFFVARYGQFGRWRTMDQMSTNGSPVVKWEHRSRLTDFTWTGASPRKEFYGGWAPNSGGNAYVAPITLAANPSSWTHGQMLQVLLKDTVLQTTITAATKANPCQITAPGHGLSNGDSITIILASGGWVAIGNQRWTISNVTTDTFTIPLDTSGFSGAAPAGMIVYKTLTFACGSLPAKQTMGPYGTPRIDVRTSSLPANTYLIMTYDQDFDALVVQTALQSGAKLMGAPPELIVSMANSMRIDVWYNIPHRADNDYVTQAATLFRDNLVSGLKVIFEPTNEIFNSFNLAFTQTLWAIAYIQAFYPAVPAGQEYNQWFGWRFYNNMTIIGSVFAGQMDRVIRMFACWSAGSDLSNVTPRFNAPNMGLAAAPHTLADQICYGSYINPNTFSQAGQPAAFPEQVWNYKQGGSLRTTALEWLDNKYRTDSDGSLAAFYTPTTGIWAKWKAIADSFSLSMCQYEAGVGLAPNDYGGSAWSGSFNSDSLTSTDRNNLFYGYLQSSYAGNLLRESLDGFTTRGGVYPAQFTLTSNLSGFGVWGVLLPNIFNTSLPTYYTLRSWNYGP